MKGLKEFIKAKKLNEDKVFVIHTKGGKVDYIEKGEYFAGPHGKMFVRDANVDLKDWKGMDPKDAKEALIHFTRIDPKSIIIEGCKKVQEATSNLREGFGELEVYTTFGPGLGIQIYPSRRGGGMAELTAHVGYVSKSSGNDTRKKELKSETEITAIDEIKVSDLKQIEKVVKKHLDALDLELEKTLKQLGYK